MTRRTPLLALSAALALGAWTGGGTFADEQPAAPAPPPAAAAAPAPADAAKPRPEVEVCFVLDTTGSMGHLIEGAKQKIWSIANTIIAVKDKPKIKIALIGYRDRGDEYVTKVFDLTDDIDTVFKNLQEFRAHGGGDGPESVNQALHEAVTKITWNPDKNVTKIVFLVGDAPPHMDYQDDTPYRRVCQAAVKKDLILNTVQCGDDATTTPVWQEIARLGEGAYVPLANRGETIAIATPHDAELAELSAKIDETVVAYGGKDVLREVEGKIALGRSGGRPAARVTRGTRGSLSDGDPAAPAPDAAGGDAGTGAAPDAPLESAELAVVADRAAYNWADDGKAIQGRGDLVWDYVNGRVKLEDLKDEDLPDELRKMSPDERKAYLEKQRKGRAALQAKIAKLSKKRQAHIAAEKRRLAEARKEKADAFDETVAEIVETQRKK